MSNISREIQKQVSYYNSDISQNLLEEVKISRLKFEKSLDFKRDLSIINNQNIQAMSIQDFKRDLSIINNQNIQAISIQDFKGDLSTINNQNIQAISIQDFKGDLSIINNQNIQAISIQDFKGDLSIINNQNIRGISIQDFKGNLSIINNQNIRGISIQDFKGNLSIINQYICGISIQELQIIISEIAQNISLVLQEVEVIIRHLQLNFQDQEFKENLLITNPQNIEEKSELNFINLSFFNLFFNFFNEREKEEWLGDLEERISKMKDLGLSRGRINLEVMHRILSIVASLIKAKIRSLINTRLGRLDRKKSNNL